MNYLTMIDAVTTQGSSEVSSVEPTSGLARLDTNIYSIPLFYNDFYENADATIPIGSNVTTAGKLCLPDNATETVVRPHACAPSRYIPDSCRRHAGRNIDVTARDTALRDSGTDTLHRQSVFSSVSEQSTVVENCPVYENDVRTDNHPSSEKYNKTRLCRYVTAAMFVGVVLGVITCSVVWLTIDKVKSNKMQCLIQNSLTLSRDINIGDDKNETFLDSEQNQRTTLGLPETDSSSASNSTSGHVIETDHHGGLNNVTRPTVTINDSLATTSSPTASSTMEIPSFASSFDSLSSTGALSTTAAKTAAATTTTVKPTVSPTRNPDISSMVTSTSNQDITETNDGTTKPSHVTTVSMTTRTDDVTQQREPLNDLASSSASPLTIPFNGETSSADVTSVTSDSPHAVTPEGDPVHAGLIQTTKRTEVTSGGHVYVRWGKLDCPDQSRLLYSGFVGGGHYIHSGGAANNLCLPNEPTWGGFSDALEADRNLIHVTEYENSDWSFNTIVGKPLHNQNVPCSVCESRGRYAFIMVPGRTECLQGWYQEYTGYLMGGRFDHPHGKSLLCVDKDVDTVVGSSANQDGNLLYFTEFRGTGTSNYVNGRELACVVCTK